METVVLLFIFITIGIFCFIIMKRLDLFLETNQAQQTDTLENKDNIIKIACENPIMLSSVSQKIEKQEREFHGASFYFYTGCRNDIQNALENGIYDIILLMGESDVRKDGCYGEKISSFVPTSLSEPLTGLVIEPVEKKRTAMYVFWNETCITEIKRKLISKV